MKRRHSVVSPLNLREVYAARGEYAVKMIIDPRESPGIDDVKVEIRNADGKSMEFVAKRWGTKLNISFLIDRSTPDGVSVIDVTMTGRMRTPIQERFNFWVVKD